MSGWLAACPVTVKFKEAWHPVEEVKEIITCPAPIPLTKPLEETVAIAELLELQGDEALGFKLALSCKD